MIAACRVPSRVLCLSLLLWGIAGFLWAPAEARAGATDSLREDIALGTAYLYDREFAQAEKLFLKTIAQAPEHPSGPFYLAMVSWSRLAAGFWTEETLEAFEERIDRAVDTGRDWVERHPEDADGFFYLGGALGFKGRFYLMQQRYFPAFTAALRAVEALEQCRALDPDNLEVLFGLGVFEYYTTKLSGVLWFLSHFLIHPGDREEGLRKLHAAAGEGAATRWEAQSMLLHIYLFLEDEPVRALPIAEEMAEQFQKNPRFAYFLGATRLRMGQEIEEVLTLIKERRNATLIPENKLIWDNTRLYLLATQRLFQGRHADARGILKTILARVEPDHDPFMAAFPRVKLAMSDDIQGDREGALALYKDVQDMENGAGAEFLAEKYLEDPMKPGDPFLAY